MRKIFSEIITLILCAALLFSLTACGEKPASAGEPASAEAGEPAAEPAVQIANPVHECTAQELVETTGMSFTEPAGAESLTYAYIDPAAGEFPLSQMRFMLNGLDCVVRARPDGIPGEELPDISGLYYDWTEESEVMVRYNTALLRLNGCEVGYVTWYDYVPGVLYSVSMTCPDNSNAAVTAEGLVALATEACPPLQGEADGESFEAPHYGTDELPLTVSLGGSDVTVAVTVESFDGDPEFGIHTLTVTDEAGSTSWGETFILWKATLWLIDVDGDGTEEIFLCGDCGSDDYVTYGWRWSAGTLEAIPFSGDTRRCADGAESSSAEGGIVSVSSDGTMMLESFTYMLGTYGSSCPYQYQDGVIAPMPGCSWNFRRNDVWLETAAALGDDLPAGTKLLLTGTDGHTMDYQTESGAVGTLEITLSPEGSLIVNGIPENSAFVSLPYAG